MVNRKQQEQLNALGRDKTEMQITRSRELQNMRIELDSRNKAFTTLMKASEEAATKHAEEVSSLKSVCAATQKSFDEAHTLLGQEKTRHEEVAMELEMSQAELIAVLKRTHETLIGKSSKNCAKISVFRLADLH